MDELVIIFENYAIMMALKNSDKQRELRKIQVYFVSIMLAKCLLYYIEYDDEFNMRKK